MSRLKALLLRYLDPFEVVRSEAWKQLNLPHPPHNFVAAQDFAFLAGFLMSRDKASFIQTHHPDLPQELLQRITTSHPELKELDIQWKYLFQEDGCRILARALDANTCITSLSLRGTKIGPSGAVFLFPALTHLTTLTSLDLSCTSLESYGASLMCSTLSHLTALTFLDLNWARLRPSVSLLCSTLKYLTALTYLGLGLTDLSADDGELICGAAAAAGMSRLKVLSLVANFCNSAVCFNWRLLRNLNLPPPIIDQIKGLVTCDFNYGPFVVKIFQLRRVISIAAACHIFSCRSIHSPYLQPSEQLGYILQRQMRKLKIALPPNLFQDSLQRLRLIGCSSTLFLLSNQLALFVDTPGHCITDHRAVALILKHCRSSFAWQLMMDCASRK
jgi:hypothetical protein